MCTNISIITKKENFLVFSIHRAARMKHEFRSELDDGEGQGDMKRRQALIDKEKRKEVSTK